MYYYKRVRSFTEVTRLVLKVVWTSLVTEMKFQHRFTSGCPLNHKPVSLSFKSQEKSVNSFLFVCDADMGLYEPHTQCNLKHVFWLLTKWKQWCRTFTRVLRNVCRLEHLENWSYPMTHMWMRNCDKLLKLAQRAIYFSVRRSYPYHVSS